MGNESGKLYPRGDDRHPEQEPCKDRPPSRSVLPPKTVPPVVIVTTGQLNEEAPSLTDAASTITSSFLEDAATATPPSSVSDLCIASTPDTFKVKQWDGKKLFSELIRDGLEHQMCDMANVVMLFECPSSFSHEASFFNSQVYKFHDWPPSPYPDKCVLGPCRYSLMNGAVYPAYLKEGAPPMGLTDHWRATVPSFVEPRFVSEVTDDDTVYAYLPAEHISKHLNDPHTHYHLAGKDALHLMSSQTPKLLTNTQDERPCICKTTHSLDGKCIFVIRNDQDEEDFNAFLGESGNPTFVITEFVEIELNVACHFFIHPNGEVTWFGSNENRRTETGGWSPDSTIVIKDQDKLRDMQLPFVKDVVRYCSRFGFWGFCGVDVLFDKNGVGYLVDVNPRVTGSCPAIMLSRLLEAKFGFEYCLFRRSLCYAFRGSSSELLHQVETYNQENYGESVVVLQSFFEIDPCCTVMNIGVHGRRSLDDCEAVLNRFAPLREI